MSAQPLAPPANAEAGRTSSSASTELMEDIDAIARKNLDAKLPGIKLRAVARAVTKLAVSQAAQRAAPQHQ